MAWLSLIAAGLFEIGWPIGLKLGWTEDGPRPGWIAFAIASMAISGALLLLAQRTIPCLRNRSHNHLFVVKQRFMQFTINLLWEISS